jgi:hypothetical protein
VRTIVEIAKAERQQAVLRLKERGTLERHELPLDQIEKIYVRLSPHPQKQILMDFLAQQGAVYRMTQDRTVIDYRSVLPQVAPGGLENFRRFVTEACGWIPEEARDPATVEFGQGARPEAFTSADELAEYNAFLQGSRRQLPAGHRNVKAPSVDPEQLSEQLAALREQEAALTPMPAFNGRVAGGVLAVMGLLLSGMGVLGLIRVVTSDSTAPQGPLLGGIGIGLVVGMGMAIAGMVMMRRAEEASRPES